MVRTVRLFLFAATSLLIGLALAYAIFAYTIYQNTSPFAKLEVFPVNVLLGIAVLAPIVLATSITGCGGLYRMSIPQLHFLVVALVISIAVHVVIGQVALKESNIASASVAAAQVWAGATETGRMMIQTDFACCGWTQMGGMSGPRYADDGHLCMQMQSCDSPVTAWRVGAAIQVAAILYAVVAFLTVTVAADVVLLRTLHRKMKARFVGLPDSDCTDASDKA
ncbi:hypothetical protein DFJ77DRAFT_514302 [Powellomyces hirtus]|nr:hypothetical protein DFJ77DRAFT_514302 [Powellomyces hirtus]